MVDGEASDGMSGDFMQFGLSVFLFPFLCAVALISFVAFRERWDKKIDLSTKSSDSSSKFVKTLEAVNPIHYPGYLGSAVESWKEGKSLTENQFRRYVSLSILYTAQGLPQGFTYVAFPAFLAVNDVSPVAIAQLCSNSIAMDIQIVWGPMVDGIQAPNYGRRRPWILFAQTGMVVTLGSLLFVSDLAQSIQLVTLMLFIHNLFSSLQDVGVDALAVDVLQPDEVAKANGFMFAAKRAGYILGGAILGIMATKFGIKSAIVIQLPCWC